MENGRVERSLLKNDALSIRNNRAMRNLKSMCGSLRARAMSTCLTREGRLFPMTWSIPATIS